jgi:hypothetical protein
MQACGFVLVFCRYVTRLAVPLLVLVLENAVVGYVCCAKATGGSVLACVARTNQEMTVVLIGFASFTVVKGTLFYSQTDFL